MFQNLTTFFMLYATVLKKVVVRLIQTTRFMLQTGREQVAYNSYKQKSYRLNWPLNSNQGVTVTILFISLCSVIICVKVVLY